MKNKRHQQTKTITTTMTSEIYNLFKNHIGTTNGLTKREIMQSVYGTRLNLMSMYEQDYYWRHVVLSVIHRLRNTTKMFIVSSNEKNDKLFFVVKDYGEANDYKEKCNKEISGMKHNMDKVERAVKEKWYENL